MAANECSFSFLSGENILEFVAWLHNLVSLLKTTEVHISKGWVLRYVASDTSVLKRVGKGCFPQQCY